MDHKETTMHKKVGLTHEPKPIKPKPIPRHIKSKKAHQICNLDNTGIGKVGRPNLKAKQRQFRTNKVNLKGKGLKGALKLIAQHTNGPGIDAIDTVLQLKPDQNYERTRACQTTHWRNT